jgi:hypothetical protein
VIIPTLVKINPSEVRWSPQAGFKEAFTQPPCLPARWYGSRSCLTVCSSPAIKVGGGQGTVFILKGEIVYGRS